MFLFMFLIMFLVLIMIIIIIIRDRASRARVREAGREGAATQFAILRQVCLNTNSYNRTYEYIIMSYNDNQSCQHYQSAILRQVLGVRGCGVSGCVVSKCYVQNPSPISALGVKSPHLQFVRVNQLLGSNPTSSNTISLNCQKPVFIFLVPSRSLATSTSSRDVRACCMPRLLQLVDSHILVAVASCVVSLAQRL